MLRTHSRDSELKSELHLQAEWGSSPDVCFSCCWSAASLQPTVRRFTYLVIVFWTEMVFRHFHFFFSTRKWGEYDLRKKLLTVARFLKVRYLRIQLLEAFVLWLLALEGGVWRPNVPVTYPWFVYSWPFSDAALLSLILSMYLSFVLPVSATPADQTLDRI